MIDCLQWRRIGEVRRFAVLVAVFAVLVGCDAMPSSIEEMADELETRILEGEAEADDRGDATGPHSGDADDDDLGATPDETGDDSPGSPGSADGGQATPGADRPDGVPIDDTGPVGANGFALLRGDVPRLVIEVGVQGGLSPTAGALDHLRAVLTRETDKPAGIHIIQRDLDTDRRQWSAEDIRALADNRRQHRSSGDEAAVYVAYLRGSFERSSAIGVAVNASTIALFPDQWRGTIEGLVGSSAAVERAVLVHELGHLMGLVEINYASHHDRHDREHPGHSTNRGSVMHWAVETTAVGQVFSGPPPDDFDEADRDDLRYLRTGSR